MKKSILQATVFLPLPFACLLLAAQVPISYVRSWEVVAPETNPNNLTLATLINKARITTSYVDGLGRPVQSVTKGITPLGKDLVSPVVYDVFGREVEKFLPYAAAINDGLYKTGSITAQNSFYNSIQSPIYGQGETFFYGKTVFEASPLNRVLKTMAPGNAWAGAGIGVEQKYWTNTATDAVRIWNVTNSTTAGVFGSYASSATGGIYMAGQLYKSGTVDERGNQVLEFKDKEGRLILKKVQLSASDPNGLGSDHPGWLCTYYIYDDLGQLRCVVQPKGVELLRVNSWSITALSGAILNEQCFRYEYDGKGRMTMKKVPGAGEVYMVYDVRDRLVMSQDANQRASGKWLVTKYDNLNRPLETGLWSSSLSFASHLSTAAGSTSYPATSSGYELLTETHYDNYTGIPTGFSTTSLAASGYGTYLDATASEYPDALTATRSLAGKVTWTKTKVLGDNIFITTCILYDEKGRTIQVQTQNYTQQMDVVTNQYSFSGQLLRSHTKHQKGGAATLTYNLGTKNTYDHAARLTAISKSLTGGGTWKAISAMTYDELGQMKSKKLAPAYNSNTGLETLDYEYNIRGWLLGINRGYVKGTGAGKFGFELAYDKPVPAVSTQNYTAIYNGNITGTIWKSFGDGEVRRYDFTYDAVNRLTGATFRQYTSGNFNTDAGVNYSVSNLSYDANGNILTMNQMGWKITGSTLVDQLRYTPIANSNKLRNVTDFSNEPTTKLGDFRTASTHPQFSTKAALTTASSQAQFDAITDYSYDANGNLTADNNKAISSIAYNHLNLPSSFTVTNKGTITYTYDAAGNKLKKTVTETGQPVKTTLYLFGTYENEMLQFLPQEEGRIRWRTTDNSFQWDYFIKDHLGNVRIVLTEEDKPDQYAALSFEGVAGSAEINNQNAFWENKNGQSINVINVRQSVNFGGTTTNAMLVRQSSANGTIGATKLLKVMAGDRIHTKVDYYYPAISTATSNNSGTTILNDIVSSITTSITNTSVAGSLLKGNESTISSQLTSNSAFGSFVNPAASANPYNTAQVAPKAYLCVLFFNEQFRFDQASSRIYPVQYLSGSAASIDRTFANAIEAQKSGYAYVYFTNESNELLYFDNFILTHERGRLREETHYYPFGLTMTGISSKAAGGMENRIKFSDKELQSKEFNDGSGLEMYDFGARFYDPQIGRWHVPDPLADVDLSWTTYKFCFNNPIAFVDPNGLLEDWYENDKGEILYDKNVNSQKDLDNRGIKGKYLGESGTAIDEQTGELVEYHKDGSTSRSAPAMEEVVISYSPSAKNSSSGIIIPWAVDLTLSGTENHLANTLNRYASDGMRGFETGRPWLPGPRQRVYDRMVRQDPFLRTRPVNARLPFGRSLELSRNVVQTTSKVLKVGGVVTAAVGVVSTEMRYQNNEISGAHRTMNHIMTGVGFFWPWGTLAAVTYALIEDKIYCDGQKE